MAPIIFALHKLRRGRRWDHTNIQPDRLSRILRAVVSHGYRFDTLTGAVTSADDKTIALTFDDGYAHLADNLPGLCAEFGIRPTVFIPAKLIGQSNRWDYSSIFGSELHLSEREIGKLADGGIDIGSHGWSHRAFTSLNSISLRQELLDSKKRLEDVSVQRIETISYPFGQINDDIAKIASEIGFRYGFTTQWPEAVQSKMTLGRIMIYGFDTPFSVMQKLDGRLKWLERQKQAVTTTLASGTVLFQRLSGRG